MLTIGDTAPDFNAKTSEGEISFHEWIGADWCILFSHPKDFTPVCTTEIGEMARLKPEFSRRNCKIIGLCIDPVEDHLEWSKDIQKYSGYAPNFPIIGDTEMSVSKLFGMLPMNASGTPGERTAMDNATVRSVFIIDPDKVIRLAISYPMTTGRNFHEVLRALDSVQLTAEKKVATPANWKNGEDVFILPSVSDDQARQLFQSDWNSPLPYMRIVPQPQP